MGSDVRGNDEQGLCQALARQLAVVCKVSANTPPPTQTLGGGGGAPAPAEAKLNVKAETNSGESESECTEEDGADFVAALEEAVGELGLSTEHVKKMPGDTARLATKEVLAIITRIAGCKAASAKCFPIA